MTLLSRVLGLVRDIIIATVFGASMAADAFVVAFRIPNLFRRLFAEGAFSQAFVPVLAEYREQRSQAEMQGLVAATAGVLGVALTAFTVIGVLASPLFIYLFAPGFAKEPGKLELASELLQITFPYLAFISLTAFAGGVLNTFRKFAVPAFTPVLLNVCMIGAAVLLAPHFSQPIVALALGVFLGGLAQLLFQFPFLRKLNMLVLPVFKPAHEGVRRVLKLMGPALFGVSVAQLNLLFDTLLASFLATGSVTWLYYSDRLLEFPLGVFGIALGTVILPTLSGHHTNGRGDAFAHTLDWGLRWMLVIGAPATLGLILLAQPILSTAFQYQAMTDFDVIMSARSLQAYSVGLLGFIAIKVLAPGYYSRQDTRSPVRIGIIALLSNMVFNVMLIFPLQHAGLALATSMSAFVNAGLLFRGLYVAGIYRPTAGWSALIVRIVAASVVMSGVLLWGVPSLGYWSDATVFQRVGQLALWVVAGAGSYGATLVITGLRPRHLAGPRGSL
ncbi:MAG: murein biosynthesis integral membrane protein MurJ [Gammaproteobacteria bacterium]|nr:murein biosynthesis integral membrane protein MurJ [Gammaproteobacteria bacterium]